MMQESTLGQRTWATILSVTILVLILSKSGEKVFVASNFAIYDQLKHLLPEGETASILIPFGQDSHTFQASPKNITKIIDSKEFFYTANGMDRWVQKLDVLKNSSNMHDLSSSITWLDGHDAHEEEEHDHEHEEDSFDPHYWFSIDNQKATAKKIYTLLGKRFPLKKEEMAIKYQAYISGLDTLHKDYVQTLQHCEQSKLFVTHDALGYLEAKDYFSVESIVGLAPQSSPNPTRMKKIIEQLKASHATTIFFESFTSNKMAVAIANEVGVTVEVLDTLATISAKQAKENRSYETLMRVNLAKFSKALACP